MTLHWWMHWFWITLLTTLAGDKLVQCAPQSEELQHLTTDVDLDHHHSDRQGRAMYFTKSQGIPTSTLRPVVPKNISADGGKVQDSKPILNATTDVNITDVTNGTSEASKISVQWTPVNVTNVNITKIDKQPKNVTQLSNETTISVNNTVSTTPPATKKRNNLTRHPEVVKDVENNLEGASENRIVTEKPLSLETAYLQTRIPDTIESSRRIIEQNFDEGGMNSGAIAGISFAALVLAALAGSTAFVLYRRRYLNKPQTLNDKCSNPDSSGYLDDSTIRDNSEEMYSLDNDSFLNSLEAMTIQNYWTDTVKHTKL